MSPSHKKSAWTPVCEVCHGRPKMDRCDCCEECWYSGAYGRAVERRQFREWGPSYRAFATDWLDPAMDVYDDA